MNDGKRGLAIKILFGNALLLALGAMAAWAGWIPVAESARPLLSAAFAGCAILDCVLGLVLVSRS